MRNNPEILAPAGDREMLSAAVRSGADAVYLGLTAFNARRSAAGFTLDQLAEAVAFCHARGVKVHVTLNTTVYAEELADVSAAIAGIAEAGADALIVQDLAVAALARSIAPALQLHGSTQMSVHSLEGALQLAEMGFDRAILARELTLEEIRYITQNCPIETEVFVHGALCMSVSGQCYMSAFLGGRSGNRGSCAGPCRLPFDAARVPEGKAGTNCHLSLKDMDIISALPRLREAGVASVKIEGRLRTPEYVAAAVSSCRASREGVAYDRDLLEAVFSRSGFTSAYLDDKRDGRMFGVRTEQDAARTREALPKARELFRREYQGVEVDMVLSVEEEGAKLTVKDDLGNRVSAYSLEEPQPARNDPSEALRRSLAKTGGTPFIPRSIEIEMNGGSWFMPGSAVNEMRRECLEKLLAKRSVRKGHPVVSQPGREWPAHGVPQQKLAARFESWEQIPEGWAEKLWRIIVPIAQADKVPESLREKTVLELPRVMFGALEKDTLRRVEATSELDFAGYEAGNIAQLRICGGLTVFGGFGLNITNPLAAAEYEKLGLSGITLLPELTCGQMAAIAPGVLTAALVYGHMPLMITRACPLQNVQDCARCSRQGILTDRKAARFPVRCGLGVRTIYNPVPIYMGDKKEQIPVDVLVARFSLETAARAARVLEMLEKGKPFDDAFTRGMFYKGTN